jgi:uncharacterized phiE125 gp8 family phage protein
MRLAMVSPPEVEPLTADEARARLNILGGQVSDETMDALITAARQQFEGPDGWLGGRALITQTWRGSIDGFSYCEPGIRIPLSPLQSVLGIDYLDGNGVSRSIDGTDIQVVGDDRKSFIRPVQGKSWPSTLCRPDAVSIDFVVGWGDEPDKIPGPIVSAIVLHIGHLRSLTAQNLFISSSTADGVGSTNYVVGEGAGKAIGGAISTLIETYVVLS